MNGKQSDVQMELLGEAYRHFGPAWFTREKFYSRFGNPQAVISFLGNGKAKGWLHLKRDGGQSVYALTLKAIHLIAPPGPKAPPLPEPTNAKAPEAILKQVRKQLEDQIDLIDEALENINRSNDDAAKFRAIEKLIKG